MLRIAGYTGINAACAAFALAPALAQGDLTRYMTGSYEGEFDRMKTSLNKALTSLPEAIRVLVASRAAPPAVVGNV